MQKHAALIGATPEKVANFLMDAECSQLLADNDPLGADVRTMLAQETAAQDGANLDWSSLVTLATA